MPKNKNRNAFSNILKGFGAGLFTFLLLLSIFSLLIMKADIQNRYFYILILISAAISSFSGAFTSAFLQQKSRLIISSITSLCILLFTFILTLCFNNASMSVKIYLIIPAALISGFIGSLTGANIRKKN